MVFPGLCLRVTAKGRKSFALMYRFKGRQERLTLGTYPALSLSKARKKARVALEEVHAGRNPAEEKRARKVERLPDDTVRAVTAEYVERHAKRNLRSWRGIERLLALYLLPRHGEWKIEDLSSRAIRNLIDDVVDQGKPVQANRVLAAIHAMLNWAVDREILETNPASRIKKPTKERARDRVLSEEELKAIWAACAALGYPAGPLIRMLILTAARRDEVRKMRWSEIDLDRCLWTLPAERSKNDQAHVVPLSPPAVELLSELPQFPSGDCVFSSSSGEQPYANLIKPKRRLDQLTGVDDWTLHDLRRTAASGMGELGVAGETIARVLNHSERAIAGVTARYNRADFTESKRRALEAWGSKVLGMTAENVVRLHG